MTPPLLLIITGPPCAGKTTLALRLAQALRLPLVTKDGIKELLFNTLGWSDRTWSKKLGYATSELIFYFVETQLAAGYSLIIESNFHSEEATPIFQALQQQYSFIPFQIVCNADPQTLLARYKERVDTHQRHPGHLDRLYYAEYQQIHLDSNHYHIIVDGPIIQIDTSDSSQIDLTDILASIRRYR